MSGGAAPSSVAGDGPAYDLIVVGAGINGAAIAREAALNGLRVLLFERGDIGAGTSSASTRLIHGGLRYLEHGELSLVRESLAERERLLELAPHLVEPLAICLPVYAHARRRPWQIRLGLWAYERLFRSPTLPKHEMLSARAMCGRLPGLNAEGLAGGAVYFDAHAAFPERLVVENVLDAVAHGASLLTRARVTSIPIDEGRARGVVWRDGAGGEGRAEATVVVNAAGPWVDEVLGARPPLLSGSKGSHVILEPFAGAPSAAVYTEAATDGRPFFVIPWMGLYLVGTTEVRYDGDPSAAHISDGELDYLIGELERLFPRAGPLAEKVVFTQAGVRPLPYSPHGDVGSISRRHFVRGDADARNLLSVIGGKLTTHRAVAEAVVQHIAPLLGIDARVEASRQRLLPGALPADARAALLAELGAELGAQRAHRLWRIYGGRARDIVARAREAPELSVWLAGDLLLAEVVHALEKEWAVSLDDILLRRTMAAFDSSFGLDVAPAVADWVCRLGIWDRARARQELGDYRELARHHRARALMRAERDGAREPPTTTLKY